MKNDILKRDAIISASLNGSIGEKKQQVSPNQ